MYILKNKRLTETMETKPVRLFQQVVKPLKDHVYRLRSIMWSIEAGCTSLWNNMTKRKSLVKDY